MLTKLDHVSPEEKRLAIEQALSSHTLARSEKLRHLLQYVCEMELDGRSGEISEYSIAVGALGRSELYSSTEDSSVRNRVFALRKKLDELYAAELTGAPVRIELSKGTYCPRFVKLDEPPALPLPAAQVAPPLAPPMAIQPPVKPRPAPSALLPFLLGAASAALIAVAVYSMHLAAARPDSVLREAWGPLLDPAGNVAVVFSVGPGMAVRPYDGPPPSHGELSAAEMPQYLYPWYKMRHPVSPGKKLYMVPSHSQASMGSVLGVTTAVRVLTNAGASFEVMPETLLPVGATRNRNLILLGNTENSNGMRHLLTKSPFEVIFDSKVGDYAIAERDGARRTFPSRRDANGKLVEVYGLLTVLPSEGSDGGRRTVLISGTYSAAISAAMDFFSSAVKMREFQQTLEAEGHPRFPGAYQLVIKATTDHVLPLGSSYQTHRVIP